MEEVGTLYEEMRRTLESHVHRAKWWRGRRDGCGREWVSADHVEGARAYADRQAAMLDAISIHCKQIWAKDEGKDPVVPCEDTNLYSGEDSEDIVEEVDLDYLE